MNEQIFNFQTLFVDVQLQQIFPDGKTFVDCLPKFPIEEINKKYLEQKDTIGFNLKDFIDLHFDLPVPHSSNYISDTSKTVQENIETLWPVLTRGPDKQTGSLIPLPYPYIVPGGRFGEIYYWDSYFTMLGLQVSGNTVMIENMVNNFSWLIDTFGYIPNGNRSYFLGRSQPPFYSLMIQMLGTIKGNETLLTYLPQLEKEYQFWMKGADELSKHNSTAHHVVMMPGGELLNRYWDEQDTARPESYKEDTDLAKESFQKSTTLFRHLRAGAESGWDYSSRWFSNEKVFSTIHTTDIIPVDLNCLLLHLEQTIAAAYLLNGDNNAALQYETLVTKRKIAIEKYCWSEEQDFYFDYDVTKEKQKPSLTLAGLYPLFLKIATANQADKAAGVIKEKFLQPGGVVTTHTITGQQWDAPNGWAPLHWVTIIGLENYGHHELAAEIAKRWIQLNTRVFKRTGKLMEKYNVIDTHLEAGGGEYAGQDGFGWTNGVLLALIKKYGA